MGEVLDLFARRKAEERAQRPEKLFYCTRCESNFFSLNTRGEVKCGSCGALMSNLAVAKGPPATTTGGQR